MCVCVCACACACACACVCVCVHAHVRARALDAVGAVDCCPLSGLTLTDKGLRGGQAAHRGRITSCKQL